MTDNEKKMQHLMHENQRYEDAMELLRKDKEGICRDIEALAEEMKKPKTQLHEPVYGEWYWTSKTGSTSVHIQKETWSNTAFDHGFRNTGNFFATEQEAQGYADMMNYVFLVDRKARELGGLVGYGHIADGEAYALVRNAYFLEARHVFHYPEIPPLQPVLTKECAEALKQDPEIQVAARKAWRVKE